MKIESRNDLTARKVLAEVKRWAALSKDNALIDTQAYVNCREQGFALSTGDDRKVAFSEFRRSDDIVVYFGTSAEFERNTNIPSEEVYESARFFRYNQIEAAAKFIVKFLES
jgi:hypothetical protein